MARVFLLRHGDAASHAPDGSPFDEGRELTPDGIARLSAACRTYARLVGSPARILHSPLVRARQSAAILGTALGATDLLAHTDELRPGGRAARVVDHVRDELLAGAGTVVLVGHEPLLGDLLGWLATGSDRVALPLATGMLAGVALRGPDAMVGHLVVLLAQADAARVAP